MKDERQDTGNTFFHLSSFIFPFLECTANRGLCRVALLTLLLLACGVLLLVVVGSSVRTVKNLFKEFFFPSAAEDNDVLTGISPLLFFLCTTTCVVVALCSFIYADSEMEGFFVIDSPIAIVGIFFAAAVVYLLLKWLVYSIVNNVLFGGNKSLQWSRSFFFVTALEGMLLFPLLLMVIYFKLSVEKGLYYFIFVLFLCKILAFFKSRSIFFRQKILFLQNLKKNIYLIHHNLRKKSI